MTDSKILRIMIFPFLGRALGPPMNRRKDWRIFRGLKTDQAIVLHLGLL